MDRCLHLQGCASRHGGGTRLGLSALVCNSVAESNHCAARFKRKIFRWAFPAAGTGAVGGTAAIPREANRFPYRFDLLARLTNDQGIMKNNSADEQALIKIQHEWAEGRMKGDRSYTQRLEAEDCTVVWPDGAS